MKLDRAQRRQRSHRRVRRKIAGTPQRPRLCICKTLRHLYAEINDDTPEKGARTLVAATTNTKAMKNEGQSFSNKASARLLGSAIAEAARAKGIQTVVFDRSGYIYHGIVKEFADACRKAGLQF